MYPTQHLISGIIFAAILFWIFPEITLIAIILIIASTVLIDVDHYLIYVWITKDWSLKNAYRWHSETGKKIKKLSKKERRELRYCFFIFHGVEPMLIVALISYCISAYLYFILIGMALHMALDMVFGLYHGYGLHKIFLMYDIGRFDESKMIHRRK